jgi:hypothetical protein
VGTALKFLTGLAAGACLAPAACWLGFVYPYSEVNLRPAWWGLAAGAVLGVVAVFAGLAWFAHDWPKD